MRTQYPPIETNLPPVESRCIEILSDTLLGYSGFRKAEFDLNNGNLHFAYDPQVLSDQQALNLLRRAGEKAWERVNLCSRKNETTCSQCVVAMQAGLAEHYQRLAKETHKPQTQYRNGLIEIQLNILGQSRFEPQL